MEAIALNTIKRNKIAGAIYGFAIGDAMGATTEFMTEKQIKSTFGKVTDIIGGGWLNLKAGEITDDTEMTMCVMDALMKYPDNLKAFEKQCANNFYQWFKQGPKDIGGQCARGIHEIIFGRRIVIDNQALGNGSLMRAMPCALVNNIPFNICQGKLTHNNSACSNIIQIYSKLIQNYISDNYNINYYNNMKSLQEPSGLISDTFHNSLYWSNKESFEEAILGAVNHGGDADTIAAITGSLAGARFGYNSIPEKWINQLNPEVKIFLEKFKNFVFSYVQI
jgi:ADP-ribosyl-[dinitrogen reductase] hydrolase